MVQTVVVAGSFLTALNLGLRPPELRGLVRRRYEFPSHMQYPQRRETYQTRHPSTINQLFVTIRLTVMKAYLACKVCGAPKEQKLESILCFSNVELVDSTSQHMQ